MKELTKKEKADLWCAVDSEGFGYYMLDYGPDLSTICKLGFDRKQLEAAIALMSKVQDAISELEEFVDEE